MPFVALHRETNERIDITRIENPRLSLKSGDCLCQLCGAPMMVKAGLIVQAHFAHYASCPVEYGVHPESPDHRQAKTTLAHKLREEMAEYSQAAIEYEVRVPEVGRIADIMVTFPMGWRIAHEIQLAGITTEQLQQRTDDYARAGIDVVWWLGKSADTPANRDWSQRMFGYSLSIQF